MEFEINRQNTGTSKIPDKENYYMTIANAVRRRANCLGRKVGAILVSKDRIISTGYNGTPTGMTKCIDGGCVRCRDREEYPSGEGYDVCICVHAEQNAILSAARFGIALQDCVLYTTLQPCFSCLKESLQSGVKSIRYLEEFQYGTSELQQQYADLEKQFDSIQQITLDEELPDTT